MGIYIYLTANNVCLYTRSIDSGVLFDRPTYTVVILFMNVLEVLFPGMFCICSKESFTFYFIVFSSFCM